MGKAGVLVRAPASQDGCEDGTCWEQCLGHRATAHAAPISIMKTDVLRLKVSAPSLPPVALGTSTDFRPRPSAPTYLVEHEDFIDLASEEPHDRIDVHGGLLDGRG